MTEIVLAKLVTGEFVVGTFYTDERLVLEDTYTVNLAPGEKGFSVALYPYMAPFERYGSDIDSKHIICKFPASKELEAEYIRVKSGLIIP
jgi:hypothetical protein